MTKNNKTTIIIVTFESDRVIENTLNKLSFDKYRVIIVDNNSKDNTCQIIEEKFPQVELIKLDQNIGYGRGNNIGLEKTDNDYALILNPDAFMLEEDIQATISFMQKHKKVALTSPLNIHQNTILNRKEIKREIEHMTNHLINTKNYKERVGESGFSTDFLVGGVLFIRMKAFKEIGFFNENIFMFCEDNEICDKSIANGYQNAIFSNAVSFHVGGSSSQPTLRNAYRRSWHLSWSKARYKEKRKNIFHAKRSTLRVSVVHFIKSIFALLTFRVEDFVVNFAHAAGSFASFIGLKAFRKNGSARG